MMEHDESTPDDEDNATAEECETGAAEKEVWRLSAPLLRPYSSRIDTLGLSIECPGRELLAASVEEYRR